MAEIYSTRLEDYADKFKDNFKLRRERGILEVTFHKRGDPLQWSVEAHSGLVSLLHDINNDWENECLIITGTGDAFDGRMDLKSWAEHGFDQGPFDREKNYKVIYKRQYQEVSAFLDLDIPVISAINGPLIVHPEHVLLADIVICSPNTSFYQMHYARFNIVPGEGCETIWRELLGPNRARYMMLTGQIIDAQEALRLGIVGEVVPRDKLLDRAWALADTIFMAKDKWLRRLTHSLFMWHWRMAFQRDLQNALTHETLGGLMRGSFGGDRREPK